jgi:hypothetical protein
MPVEQGQQFSDPAEGHADFYASRATDLTNDAKKPGQSSVQRAAKSDDAWVASKASKAWSKKTNKAKKVK